MSEKRRCVLLERALVREVERVSRRLEWERDPEAGEVDWVAVSVIEMELAELQQLLAEVRAAAAKV